MSLFSLDLVLVPQGTVEQLQLTAGLAYKNYQASTFDSHYSKTKFLRDDDNICGHFLMLCIR